MNIDSRYQIIEKAGSGGMATVYRARDKLLNRDVAIKVMHPHLIEKEEVKKRFLREAQAIARLRHKNIIEIFDYHSDETDCYIISEFIKGESLASFLSKYDISSPFIAAMIVSVLADAIGHAHRQNVIHRDLKPENILISESYELKITDFGIAHIADAESLTITGSISGSPAHMSPEQIDGKEVNIKTDIFSLGTILYLISCGELPFKGNSPASIFKSILLGEYKEPKELNPLIDNRFSSIIRKCLKKNIDERYGNSDELKMELVEYLKGYGITDVEENLKNFFSNPIEYLDDLNKKIIKYLKDYLYKNISRRENRLIIQDYLNILAYLNPDDADGKALFKRFTAIENTYNRLKNLRTGTFIISVILLAGLALYFIFPSLEDIKAISYDTTPDLFENQEQNIFHDSVTISSKEEEEEGISKRPLEENASDRDIKKPRKRVIQRSGKTRNTKEEVKEQTPAIKYGELNLYIKPYGDIYINNILYGKEKATLKVRLKYGRYNLLIKNPYYFDIKREINVESESRIDLRLVFDRIKPAKLFINSSTVCDIYIDGNPLGRSDMYIKNGITIPIDSKDGRREILLKASRNGYNDFSQKIKFTAGEIKSIKINLTEKK